MRSLAYILLATLAAPAALADSEEASFHLELAPAFLHMEDLLHNGATTTVPAPRASLRATYGLGNKLAAEVSVGATIANSVELPRQMTPQGMGTIHQDFRALRAAAGLTARLGVTLIPTFTAAAGYQHRWMTGGALLNEGGKAFVLFPDAEANDLVVTGGIGLDYRLGVHLMVGISIQYTHAVPAGSGPAFDSVEIPVHIGYYFYPGWFRGEGFLPGGTPLRWRRNLTE